MFDAGRRPMGRLFYWVLTVVIAASGFRLSAFGAEPGPQSGPATTTVADMPGMLSDALLKANELKVCLTLIAGKTDSADPNLATLNNILASLT